jgi:outer membrane protein
VEPAVLLQYYFGAATAKFRPFLGLGVSYNWFSDLQLNTNFIKQTQDNLGAILAAGAGKPGTTSVEAKASSSWQPVFNAGLQYNLTEHFGLIASVTYIPLKTTSTVTIKAADGTVLAESKSELKADPIISYVGMTYKF